MPCTSTYLFIDMMIWMNPTISSWLLASYQNLSLGDKYDCGLTSVPCESNLTKALVSTDPEIVLWIEQILVYAIGLFVFLLGLFGNIINIIILSTNNIANDSTNNLLLATSVSDLVYVLSVGVSLINTYMCFFDTALALSLFNASSIHLYMMWQVLGLLSLDFITVLSIQRAAAVVFPFKVSKIFSYRNTNIVIILLVILQGSTRLAKHATSIPQWMYHPYFGKRVSLGYTFGIDYDIGNYVFVPYTTSRTVIDLTLLVISASILVHKLKKQVKHRLSLSATNPRDNGENKGTMTDREVKVVRLSVTVCYTTFIVYLLETTGRLNIIIYDDKLFTSWFFAFIYIIARVIGTLACSFNFVIYITMSLQFRQAFIKMFKASAR